MQLSHKPAAVSSAFDDPNLVSAAGLLPAMGLAWSTGLGALVDEHLHLPDYFGANAGLKVSALVAGMLAGVGCIDLCRARDYAEAAARPVLCAGVRRTAARHSYRLSRNARILSVGWYRPGFADAGVVRARAFSLMVMSAWT